MIFGTGDTHGTHDIMKLGLAMFPEQKHMTKNDYVIVAGDFGGVFHGKIDMKKMLKEHPELKEHVNPNNALLCSDVLDRDAYTLNLYHEKPFTTLFIDGNHENFDVLNSYPVEEWNGGFVHKIRPDIIHLMRGQVYTIEGKTFFTMGGATSIDKHTRIEGKSWWKEELPTYEECNAALDKLDEVGWKVDYVITHSAPDNILYRINPTFGHDIITNLLFTIDKQLEFKHWYFGHYHIDQRIDDLHTCLYQNVVRIV